MATKWKEHQKLITLSCSWTLPFHLWLYHPRNSSKFYYVIPFAVLQQFLKGTLSHLHAWPWCLPQQGQGMLPLQWSIAGADGCVEGDLKESCTTSFFVTSRYYAVVSVFNSWRISSLTCWRISRTTACAAPRAIPWLPFKPWYFPCKTESIMKSNLWLRRINACLLSGATEVVPAMTSEELKSTSHYHRSKQQQDCNPTSYVEPPNVDSRM